MDCKVTTEKKAQGAHNEKGLCPQLTKPHISSHHVMSIPSSSSCPGTFSFTVHPGIVFLMPEVHQKPPAMCASQFNTAHPALLCPGLVRTRTFTGGKTSWVYVSEIKNLQTGRKETALASGYKDRQIKYSIGKENMSNGSY